jgi:RNA binding exosome subunit
MYKLHYTTPATHTLGGKEIVNIILPLMPAIRKSSKIFPQEVKKIEEIPYQFRILDLFSLLTVNYTCNNMIGTLKELLENLGEEPIEYYKDKQDERLCIVIPLGSFKKGELGISGLACSTVVLKAQLGDFVVFYGNRLYHSVTEFIEDRMSLVLCTKQKTLQNTMRIVNGEDVLHTKKK